MRKVSIGAGGIIQSCLFFAGVVISFKLGVEYEDSLVSLSMASYAGGVLVAPLLGGFVAGLINGTTGGLRAGLLSGLASLLIIIAGCSAYVMANLGVESTDEVVMGWAWAWFFSIGTTVILAPAGGALGEFVNSHICRQEVH